eukprot:314855-Prorocentrum_minimum.AAC.1
MALRQVAMTTRRCGAPRSPLASGHMSNRRCTASAVATPTFKDSTNPTMGRYTTCHDIPSIIFHK